MGQARDERKDERGIENDTALMEPSAEEPGTKMTGKGAIPPVQDGFADTGPSASDRAYGGYVRVTASTLNVRSSPTTRGQNIIGKLHRGALVEQIGRQGEWVEINNHGTRGFVHHAYVEHADTRPSAESSREVMQMFREVNGDEGRGAPPGPEAQAEVMEMFREVNGDQGRGAPPGPEAQAEVMEMFREVNGDQGRGAPPGPEAQAEVMQMFREVNGDEGRGAPPKLSPEERQKLLDDLE
jgi:hypothetical protein